MLKKIKLMLVGMLFASHLAFANNEFAIDLQDVSIRDALHLFSKFIHQNIIISPDVSNQMVTLHLRHLSYEEAFELLLSTHNLSKRFIGSTWYIAPRDIILKKQQEEIAMQTTLDESAPLLTRVWQIRYAKSEDVAKLLQESSHSMLSKRGHLNVDSRTNIICIQDTVFHLNEINHLIKKIDVQVPQVLIEARLASVDSDHECELGVNFSTKEKCANDVHMPGMIQTATRFSLAVLRLADGSFLDMQLSALEEAGHGELISSPSLFTTNQQTASIESGEEIPYQEVSRSGGTAVAFKKAVLSLKVTPQIMPGNKILLQLQVNQDKPSKRVVLGVPAINTRQIMTNVLVENGQTIVLGGIYESNQENAEHRIPFFGRIPIVGWLFKQRNVSDNKRELLIFVTPKIIG